MIQKDTLQAFAAPRAPCLPWRAEVWRVGGGWWRDPTSPWLLFAVISPHADQLQWVKEPETEGRMMPFGDGFDPNQDILVGRQRRRTFNTWLNEWINGWKNDTAGFEALNGDTIWNIFEHLNLCFETNTLNQFTTVTTLLVTLDYSVFQTIRRTLM